MKAWKLSLILFTGSLVLTIFCWRIGLPFFFLFLFIPFLPFLTGPKTIQRCPVCGWETAGSERFCPYDATPLENADNREGREGR